MFRLGRSSSFKNMVCMSHWNRNSQVCTRHKHQSQSKYRTQGRATTSISHMSHCSNNVERCNSGKHSGLNNLGSNLGRWYKPQPHQADRTQKCKKYNSSPRQSRSYSNEHKASKSHHASNSYQSTTHRSHRKSTQSNRPSSSHKHLKKDKSAKCIEYKCRLGNLNIGDCYRLGNYCQSSLRKKD